MQVRKRTVPWAPRASAKSVAASRRGDGRTDGLRRGRAITAGHARGGARGAACQAAGADRMSAGVASEVMRALRFVYLCIRLRSLARARWVREYEES